MTHCVNFKITIDTKHFHVYFSAIYKRQGIEPAYMSILRWINNENAIHIHIGVLFSHKKE